MANDVQDRVDAFQAARSSMVGEAMFIALRWRTWKEPPEPAILDRLVELDNSMEAARKAMMEVIQ